MTRTRLRQLMDSFTTETFEMMDRINEYSSLVQPHRIRDLLDTIDCLKGALEDAADTIHDEFCGSNGHHPLCDKPRAALAKLSEDK